LHKIKEQDRRAYVTELAAIEGGIVVILELRRIRYLSAGNFDLTSVDLGHIVMELRANVSSRRK
jgi:hypothetical protein